MKIEIYDPAMCCSSGMCGPDIDPVLLKMNEAVLALQKQGVGVTRFNLAQQPREFMNNKEVSALLQKDGNKALPITLVNGSIFRTGQYASYEELCEALGIEPLDTGKPMTFL